jgi:pimeloyl-ACP methyl ester carboxylesterase
MAEPLVLVPGLMCDARLFQAQVTAFSATRAVQVATITAGDTITEMAEAVLAAAPERFALAGLSMGGIVAMEIARLAPGRLSRLALMDTSPLPETPEAAAQREPQIAGAKAGRLEDVIREEIKPRYLAPGPGRVSVIHEVVEMARALGPDVFVRQSRALQRRPDAQPALREVSVPTLILCGRHDGLCPVRLHEYMQSLVPGSNLEIIETAGHLPPLETPEATTAALGRWLNGTLLLT